MSNRTNINTARVFIARRQPFEAGGNAYGMPNFRGEEAFPLNAYSQALRGTRDPDDVIFASYVVYSYRTPIAWFVPERGWIVNETKYSISTTRHQSAVAQALSPSWDVEAGAWKSLERAA